MNENQGHKQITIEDLKVIQMDILQVIHEFCQQNGIRYSLACGTFLGAIRHKGYIPWDDDIDIYIPRDDYERFIATYPDEFQYVQVVSLERDNHWDRAYAQAFDNRTIMQEDVATSGAKGVYIDIYPIDDVPDTDKEWISYNKKRRCLVHLSEIKYVRLNKDRSFAKNVALLLGKLSLLPFSSRAIAKYISKYAQKNNGNGYNRCFECVQGMLQKRPFSSSLMNEFVDVQFENHRFMIMKDYNAYLSNAYGDYMKLPPKEQRVSHHLFRAWWK